MKEILNLKSMSDDRALSFIKGKLDVFDRREYLILKTHLLVETFLIDYINTKLSNAEELFKDANFTFRQKMILAKSLHNSSSYNWLWDVVLELNKIRNYLSHNIVISEFNSKISHLYKLSRGHIFVEKKYKGIEELRCFLLILLGEVYNLNKS